MAGEERQRENMWVCGNADICQEIDNSNKLVAKHSNRLPNGTIVHSNPRLRTKHRISPRCNGCTCVCGCDVRAIQCVYYLLAGILRTDGELITDRFAILFRLLIVKSYWQDLTILSVTTIEKLIILFRVL